ncbi:MAG: HIT family protein [Candidatus Izemoplasma sp.]
MDCIFCKILNDDISSYKIYEDDNVLAFLDITQGTKGHTLLIPKQHIANIYDLDEDLAEKVFKVIPKIARALKKSFNPIGINIMNNNQQPLQSVFHYHIHLIPRYKDDGMIFSTVNNFGKFSDEYLTNLTKTIKENL